MIEIDGSYGEGGGQIIRTSVSLAAICGKPVHIKNVRAKRAKPGLQNQHLMAVKAAAEICRANLTGVEVGSTEFTFEPTRDVRGGEYRFDIGTAGASNLVLQTVLVPLALSGGKSSVTVTGGTHNPMAPPSDYMEHVYLPALSMAGLQFEFESPRNGFYPRGGGEITAKFFLREQFKPLSLISRGKLLEAGCIITKSQLDMEIAKRGKQSLREFVPDDWDIRIVDKPSLGAGIAVFGYTQYDGAFGGFTSLGEKGKPMYKVVEECGSQLEKWLAADAAVDEHLADQLVLPMCFAKGTSRWRAIEVTEHLRTVLWLVTAFLPVSTEIEELPDGSGIVRIDSNGP